MASLLFRRMAKIGILSNTQMHHLIDGTIGQKCRFCSITVNYHLYIEDMFVWTMELELDENVKQDN